MVIQLIYALNVIFLVHDISIFLYTSDELKNFIFPRIHIFISGNNLIGSIDYSEIGTTGEGVIASGEVLSFIGTGLVDYIEVNMLFMDRIYISLISFSNIIFTSYLKSSILVFKVLIRALLGS